MIRAGTRQNTTILKNTIDNLKKCVFYQACNIDLVKNPLSARLNLYNNFDDKKKNNKYNLKFYNNIAIYLQKE